MSRVLLADDHPIVRQGIMRLLSQIPDVTGADEVSSVDEIRAKMAANSYGLLILDISIPGNAGLEALKEVRGAYPNVPVLVLSVHPEEQYAVRSLKAGASGYLNKECAPEHLAEAIRRILQGGRYVSPKVADLLASQLGQNLEQAPHELLSEREFQILLMIGSGKGLTEIAENFALSVKTVSTYRSRILKKMKMKNNAEIIRYVLSSELRDAAGMASSFS